VLRLKQFLSCAGARAHGRILCSRPRTRQRTGSGPRWEVKTLAAQEAMNYDSVLAQRKKNSVANQRLLSAAGLSTTSNVDTAVLHEDTQRRMLRLTKPFIDDGVRITRHGLEYTAYAAKQGRLKTPNNPLEYSDRYIRTMQYATPPSLYTRRGVVYATSVADFRRTANDERQPRPSSAMSRGFGGLESRPVSGMSRPTTAMGGGGMSPCTFDSSVALCDTLEPFRPLSALAHSRGRSSMADNPYAPRRVYSPAARKSGNSRLRPSSSPAETLAHILYESMLYSGFV
jgi:hypothetical protein